MYAIGERLAVGGMGEIYSARAEPNGREVAVKRVIDADGTDENLRLLFLREVAVAATLEHHAVVEVIDVGIVAGELFLVMELVDGPSLAEVLDALYRQGKMMPVDIACGLVSQVLVGLAHAHERAKPDGTPLGIIHRDVAPENILLGRDGVPKILDFGLAKLAGHSLTEPGIVRGRPRSLSPEQARGEAVDPRSDIFAAGAILFELISGEQLYPNEAMSKLLFKVASGDYAPIEPRVPPGTDPDLVRIIQKAIAIRPEDRYGSARKMGRDLSAFLAVREMRMSNQALAELVEETFPKVKEIRSRAPRSHPGELTGREITLPADADAQAPPSEPAPTAATPPSGAASARSSMPSASELPESLDDPAAGLAASAGTTSLGELPRPRRATREDARSQWAWWVYGAALLAATTVTFFIVLSAAQ